ncbi:hypothetical protein MOP98_09580 [Stenotrophomonas maltophilia]|nr:hypothetical protein [Stenotrophomonas maltophilia]
MTNDQHKREDRSSLTGLGACALLNVIGVESELVHPLLRARHHAFDEQNIFFRSLGSCQKFLGARFVTGNRVVDFLQNFCVSINIDTTAIVLEIRAVLAHHQARGRAWRISSSLNQVKRTTDCGALSFKVAQLLLKARNLSAPLFHLASGKLMKPGQVVELKVPRPLSSAMHDTYPLWWMSSTGVGDYEASQPMPRSDLLRGVQK